MIAGNLHRDVSDVRLFELGTVFSGTTEKVDERPALAFGAVGSLPEQGALHAARAIEFHDVKGVVEQVLARFQMRGRVYFDRFPADAGLTPQWLHPYRAARVVVDGVTVGWFGQLHPARGRGAQNQGAGAGRRDLSRPALQAAAAQARRARDLALPAGAPRFFAGSGREHRAGKHIDRALAGLQIPELVEWRVREVFRDARLGAREYALLLGATFQAPDRTLREEELQEFQAQVVEAVGKAGARLRV